MNWEECRTILLSQMTSQYLDSEWKWEYRTDTETIEDLPEVIADSAKETVVQNLRLKAEKVEKNHLHRQDFSLHNHVQL